jgi:WD40 repeat protein
MKKLLLLVCLILIPSAVFSYSLVLFDLNRTNFPTIQGKLYLLDDSGNVLTNVSHSDFELEENGVSRQILSISCPPTKEPEPLSVVLTIDVSGSMEHENRIGLVQQAALTFLNLLPLGKSECAVTSFNSQSYIVQDFTIDREKLTDAILSLFPDGGTDYDAGLFNPPGGSLKVSATGKNKRIVIFLTDGEPNKEPDVDAIVNEAIRQNCSIYSVVVGMRAPQCLKDISTRTGGLWFENVTTQEQVTNIYKLILLVAEEIQPCIIEWASEKICSYKNIDVVLRYLPIGLIAQTTYLPPENSIVQLVFEPNYLSFKNIPPDSVVERQVKVTAVNSDFNVTNISSPLPQLLVEPSAFFLKDGQSIDVKIIYNSKDSAYRFVKLNFENDKCPSFFFVYAGFLGKRSANPTLKVTHPNGGEVFLLSSDTIITWEGISPEDTCVVDYSYDGGGSWVNVALRTPGLKYVWQNLPPPPSDKCLARVRQIEEIKGSKKPGMMQFSLGGHTDDVTWVSWSPDGKMVATAGMDALSIIWSAETGEQITYLNYLSPMLQANWSPDSRRIVTASIDGTAEIWEPTSGKLLFTLIGHSGPVRTAYYNPDGSKILTSSDDKSAIIWDAGNGQILQILQGHFDRVKCAKWSPNGAMVATASDDHSAIIWDSETGEKIHVLFGHNAALTDLDWSPDGSMLATSGMDSTIIVWDVLTGDEVFVYRGHRGEIKNITWNPDGTKLVSAGVDGTAIIWGNGSILRMLFGHTDIVNYASWNSDGSLIATVGNDMKVMVWDSNTGELRHLLQGHTDKVVHLSWSPDGNFLATAGEDESAIVWDWKNDSLLYFYGGHNGWVRWLAWSPDGDIIATGGGDKKIKLWSAKNGVFQKTLIGHKELVNHISWSPSGTVIASGSLDYSVIVWDSKSGNLIRTFNGHTGGVYCTSWRPDGTYLATTGADGNLFIWDVVTGDSLFKLNFGNVISNVAWNPDGSLLAVGTYSGNAYIVDFNSKSILRTLNGHSEWVSYVAWSPDGTKLATAGYDGQIIIWDAMNGSPLLTLQGHTAPVIHIAWSPDGNRIASASGDATSIIWESSTGKVLQVLQGHKDWVNYVDWDPSGYRIATASWDGTARVWNAIDGKLLFVLAGHHHYVSQVVWNPEGTRVATASADHTARVWVIDTIKVLQEDISDSTFSIVIPSIAAKSINMGQCAVGSNKDSVVTSFLTNLTPTGVRVDTIFFEGGDAESFKLVAGIPPFNLDSNQTKDIEFRFIPQRIGEHSSTVVICFWKDTIKVQIVGEGVMPSLQIVTKILDFGKVEVGNDKVIEDTALLKNISTVSVAITDVIQLGPDDKQFEIVSGGGKFILQSNEERKLTIRFKPLYAGRTTGSIGFKYDGPSSPAIVQLFGEGIGGIVYVPNDSAYPGEKRYIRLLLGKIKEGGLTNIARSFKAILRFQSSVLGIRQEENGFIIQNDSTFLNVGGIIGTNLEIARIPVIAGLGTVEETTIDVVDFELFDSTGKKVYYDITKVPGVFRILGICREGGSRLVNTNGQAGILELAPNPAQDIFNIRFNLIEEGKTEIEIYNSMGLKVDRIFSENVETLGERNIEYSTAKLSCGNYLLVFRTPTIVHTLELKIIK